MSGAQAQIDGPGVPVRIEEEPGSAGKIVTDHYARHVLPGARLSGCPVQRQQGRAGAASCCRYIERTGESCAARLLWVRDLVNEMRSFPLGTHDDQVDSMSGAMTALTQQDRIQSVLPRSMVQLCVDAYRKHEREIVTYRRCRAAVRGVPCCRDQRGPHLYGDSHWPCHSLG